MLKIFEKIKKPSIQTIALVAIIALGIFLRSYNFHDWLRFNADQARDASVVSSVVEGKEAWPLLGPKAGGTNFKLGGAFYYFEIISAKIFGNYPDKMAYPDLFFSILAMPLFYILMKKYFNSKIAIALLAIFSVSVFAIKYSRFAWNPNSTPFWSMLFLYALYEIFYAQKNKKLYLAIIAGIALGIGVQLHTLLLVFLPVMTLFFLGYMFFCKQNTWKVALIIISVGIFLNIPQIFGEYQTGGKNIQAFFGGIGSKEKKGSGLIKNVITDTLCYSQANTYVLSGYLISDTCEIKTLKNFKAKSASAFGFVILLR